jgi:hypothetical protein
MRPTPLFQAASSERFCQYMLNRQLTPNSADTRLSWFWADYGLSAPYCCCSDRSRHAAPDRRIWQSRLLRIQWKDWIIVHSVAAFHCNQHNISNPRLLPFGHHNIPVLSRFEHLVQISPLRLGRHERSMLLTRHIEVTIHIAAGAELDLEFPLRRKISDRSYARGTNWNSPHRQASLNPANLSDASDGLCYRSLQIINHDTE